MKEDLGTLETRLSEAIKRSQIAFDSRLSSITSDTNRILNKTCLEGLDRPKSLLTSNKLFSLDDAPQQPLKYPFNGGSSSHFNAGSGGFLGPINIHQGYHNVGSGSKKNSEQRYRDANDLNNQVRDDLKYMRNNHSRFRLWPGFLLPGVVRALTESGDHLGLSEDELIAASALSAIGCGALWLAVCILTDLPVTSVAAAFLLGAFLPWFRLRAVAQDRAKSVTRSLPGVIELAAMCMGAGLDFPSSLRRVVESAAQPEEPIVEELQRVLQELDLGCTRRSAMHGLAARVPSDEVRELLQEQASVKADIETLEDETGFGTTLGVLVQANNVYRARGGQRHVDRQQGPTAQPHCLHAPTKWADRVPNRLP